MNFISVTEVLQNKKTLVTELNLDNVERLVKNEESQTIVVYFRSGDNISIEPFDLDKIKL